MPDTPSLPKSSYAILGLLSFHEASGYDLKQLADRSVGYFYGSPARSQVYSELRRLADLGYATEREVEQDDRPDKRLYTITDAGLTALHDWLENEPTATDVTKSHLLLKVFFGRHMNRESLIKEVQAYRQTALEFVEYLHDVQARCDGRPGTLFTYLTTSRGLAQSRAAAEWAEEAIQELESADEQFTWTSDQPASETTSR